MKTEEEIRQHPEELAKKSFREVVDNGIKEGFLKEAPRVNYRRMHGKQFMIEFMKDFKRVHLGQQKKLLTAEFSPRGIRRPFYFKSIREAQEKNPTWCLWREEP